MKIAVIQTGGKQYLVTEGDTLMVEKLPNEPQNGASVSFEILMTDDGSLDLKPASKVTGTVIETGKHDTVLIVRYKQKSRYHKKRGHRQPYTKVKIDKV